MAAARSRRLRIQPRRQRRQLRSTSGGSYITRHDRHRHGGRPSGLVRPRLVHPAVQHLPDAADDPGRGKPRRSATRPRAATTTTRQTLTCTLKPDLKFSNGDDLTSSDVKYSFERALDDRRPERCRDLPARRHRRDRQGGQRHRPARRRDRDARRHDGDLPPEQAGRDVPLRSSPTRASGAIVDEDVFPADKKLADDAGHRLRPVQAGQVRVRQQAVLQTNDNYPVTSTAEDSTRSSSSYYQDSSALKLAVAERRDRHRLGHPRPDRPHRARAGQRRDRRRRRGRRDPLLGLARRQRSRQGTRGPAGGRPDHRPRRDRQDGLRGHGDAAVLDRAARASTVSTESFKDAYGAAPDVAAAKQTLADAGVQTPVEHHDGLHADALRPQRRRRGDRVQAGARGQRPVQGRR